MTDFTYRNLAVGDTRRRKGKRCFTAESFYDLAERLKGQTQAFSMFLSYGEEFMDFVEAPIVAPNGKTVKDAWSCRGWSGEAPATFVDFPVDFDASEDFGRALEQTRKFVHTELIGRGIDERYFVVYLSGGKGLHVHISASVLDLELPAENAGFRLKALVAQWHETYPTIDLSVYNSTALFRLPGSKHKSGLHKTEIAVKDLTDEHLAERDVWAAEPPVSIRMPELGSPPVRIPVPDGARARAEYSYDINADFDPTAAITPNCPWLQSVLADPSNGGNDGKGREKRRNAIGILLSAHETSEANPELQWYVNELLQHDYMQEASKAEDVYKWIREYDRDGEIKCAKTCYSVGCSAAQRKLCGTRSPLDWKLKKRKLALMTVAEARARNKEIVRELLSSDDDGVTVLPWPVGIGKTHNLLKEVSEQGLTAFYLAQTHALAIQTHHQFEAAGLDSRHIGSRDYLSEAIGFDCLAPVDVSMAMSNGYGSHTVCGQCPRKRKRRQDDEGAVSHEPDDGFDPCDYFDQFEDLKTVDVVVGVHNHLYEFMYEAAAVAGRSVTVIDESPLEALGREVAPIPHEKLAAIRDVLVAMVDELKVPADQPKPGTRKGMFGRAYEILEAQLSEARSAETKRRLRIVEAYANMFNGLPFDVQLLAGMPDDALRASWFELATEVAERSGLADKYDTPAEARFLCVPWPAPSAIALAALDRVYDPTRAMYLPVQLPPNKTLILDATASNDVYASVAQRLTLGPDARPYQYVEHPLVEQPYSKTTQITSSSYGVSRLYDEAQRDYLGQLIVWLRERHPGKSLVVCHKQHAAYWQRLFAKDPLMEVATYGSLKGLNRWADCVAQYIVGTPFVPDAGIRDLCARLGEDVELGALEESAALRRSMLLARNGDTCITSRRIYAGLKFHTSVAQMRSQWEVTQAVRLRLYDRVVEGTQHLYVFSNVELRGMYADEYKTTAELAWELQKERDKPSDELEVKGVAYDKITAWFKKQPVGTVFKRANIPPFASDRYLVYWLAAAVNAGWVRKVGRTYERLI